MLIMHVAPRQKHLEPDAAPSLHERPPSRQQDEEGGHVARLVDPKLENLGSEQGSRGTVA
jgi:hypothetical protein